MRIGIVTLPLQNNYGGILQNWALQQVLKRMGHQPYTIRILVDRLRPIRWLIHDIKSLIKALKGEKVFYISPFSYYSTPVCAFNSFVKKHIQRTKPYNICPKKVINQYKLDALITGSDQVWRPTYNSHIEDQFLGFAQGANIRKIAYAASFGTSDWEYSTALEAKCKELVNELDAVSVREESGIILCKEHFSIDPSLTLDPTLLLQKEDYLNICLPRQISEPYIFAYILDGNKKLKQRISEEVNKKNLKLVFKSVDGAIEKGDSIELWLSLIANADFVFTDSYHGTIFSMIFKRQFITVVNKDRGATRFESLIKIFPISERIINNDSLLPQTPLDYEGIDKILLQEKQRSQKWLLKVLSR